MSGRRTGVVEGGGVGEVGEALPVVGEEAVGAQLAADGNAAPRAELPPHAPSHRQACIARHPHQFYAVRPLAPLHLRLVSLPVPATGRVLMEDHISRFAPVLHLDFTLCCWQFCGRVPLP